MKPSGPSWRRWRGSRGNWSTAAGRPAAFRCAGASVAAQSTCGPAQPDAPAPRATVWLDWPRPVERCQRDDALWPSRRDAPHDVAVGLQIRVDVEQGPVGAIGGRGDDAARIAARFDLPRLDRGGADKDLQVLQIRADRFLPGVAPLLPAVLVLEHTDA